MKEMIMKRFAALALALLMLAMMPAGALAEGEDITTPTDLAPVITEESTDAENASNVTEETTETVAKEAAVEPTVEPTAEPTVEPAPQGTVRIILLNEGPLYYGDEVALLADVDNVEDEHTLTWQVKVDIDKWENIAVGRTYRFTLTPENASMEYRVVVNVAE